LWISGVVRAKSISGEHYAKAHFLAIGWDEIPPSSTDATAWKIDSERKKQKSKRKIWSFQTKRVPLHPQINR
jgi:hypothetical protein